MSVGHDARKLEKAYPDELCGRLNGFIELNRLVKAAELPVFENAQKKKPVKEKMSSLATLVEVYLQQDLPKPKNERLGDWAVETLSYEQVQYAATDAYACYALFCEIRRRFAQSKGTLSQYLYYVYVYSSKNFSVLCRIVFLGHFHRRISIF